MRVRFWGTRGSLPIAADAATVRDKVRSALVAADGRSFDDELALDAFIDTLPFEVRGTYGGNSSCVEVEASPDAWFLCDLGSGLRAFGQQQVENGRATGQTYNFFVSHVHWDHIMGFPFFVPAYIPGNTIRIHGCHDVLEEAFRRQQSAPSFPVPLSVMNADIEFVVLPPDTWHEIDGVQVRAMLQEHAGDSYGWRFEHGGKALIYSTDAEHKLESDEDTTRYIDFIAGADMVIFDAMYSLADAISVKEDWGHSSNIVGVDLCHRAGVRHYCMFHHEPIHDDATIERILDETRRYEELMREGDPLEVLSAWDGLVLDI